MKCPKCRFEQPDGGIECVRCGLIFAKFKTRPNLQTSSRLEDASFGAFEKGSTMREEILSNPVIEPDDLRVQKEKNALYFGLVAIGILFLIVLGISLGTVLVLVMILGFWVKVRQGQLLGQSVKVTEAQLPEVFVAAREAAQRLCMRMPDVFVVQNPSIGAYALGFLGRKSIILNSATVEAMEPSELRAIIGHEFTHIKCDHTNWIVFTNLNDAIWIPIISDLIGFILLNWSRKVEYTADRGGLLASRDLRASVSALAKVAVGRELFNHLNLDEFFKQRDEIGQDDLARLSETLSTHPYIVNRIHALKAYIKSVDYQRLSTLVS